MQDSNSPAQSPSEFVAVTGSQETTSAEALLITAYAAMWLILFLFLFFTMRRQTQLSARLSNLEAKLGLPPPDALKDAD